MSIGGTAAYEDQSDLPELVRRALELAREVGFEYSCLPAQGRLLQALAAGRSGGLIGETGTGAGVGLAWMASAVGPSTRLVSVEIDPALAAAVRELFVTCDNVTVLSGGWGSIVAHGPFDLLVLDGGGTGKPAEVDPEPADPEVLLQPGGTMVIDDFAPSEAWPPRNEGGIDISRLHWLSHPALLATEVRVTPAMATVIGMRRPEAEVERE